MKSALTPKMGWGKSLLWLFALEPESIINDQGVVINNNQSTSVIEMGGTERGWLLDNWN